MGLKTFWKSYKVLIVMGTGLGLVHWGWFHIKSSPIFQVKTEDFVIIDWYLSLHDVAWQKVEVQAM
uniref:Uncharacterized protein n=2 Tax=Anas TaxID=8835 RepID=A0A8B9U8K9_9AVES